MRDLCQHIMDLVENAVAAGAGRVSVVVSEDAGRDRLVLRVEDDGRGMPAELAERAADPFCTTRTTRRVGLGLSLLEAAARRAGGRLAIRSAPGAGTCAECSLVFSHVDTPPMGDVVGTLAALVAVHPNLDLSYEHRAGRRRFRMDLAEVREALGEGVELSQPAAVGALRRHLAAQWEAFRSAATPMPEGGGNHDPVGMGVETIGGDPVEAASTKARSVQMKERGGAECACEQEEARLYGELQGLLAKYRGRSHDLIQVLHQAQNLFGYLPQRVQSMVAQALGLTEAEVEGVVSFYHYFTRVPRGRHRVHVCLGTACYVRGGRKIVERLEKDLAVEVGGTTEDREFSLETVRCIGACGLAPVMKVDEDVYRRVPPARAGKVLGKYAGGESRGE